MKKILMILILALTVAGPVQAQKKKQSRNEKIAGAIARQMMDKNLIIYITNVMSDWGSQNYPQGLKVTLINNKFTCNLPFQGSSRVNTYGSQDLYIKAENAPVEISSNFNKKKNFYEIKFNFTSEYDNEIFNVIMKVFTNGKVSIEISSPKRSIMRYNGGIQVMI